MTFARVHPSPPHPAAIPDARDTPRAHDRAGVPPATADAQRAIAQHRARAERVLNVVRLGVLLLLAGAAIVYAPHIPAAVRRVNWIVLAPVLAWSALQLIAGRRGHPAWWAIANPLVDITAVTAILLGYGLAASAALALKSPIFLAYFVILAARPMTSSTRKAALAAALVVAEYAAISIYCIASGRVALTDSPLAASTGGAVAPLDEGAKIMLLVLAGVVATYATAWHEGLVLTHQREVADRARLEVELTRAQLDSLKLQLNPHFLFNTLNSISALIATDADAAERMLGGLSDFLRLSLTNSGAQEVPLERELQMLERYLMIQQLRFQHRLRITVHADAELSSALVPNLLLQPLAENAIKHGIGPRARGGHLEVRAERRGDTIVLRVADDGVGCELRDAAAAPPRHVSDGGIGLGNTRARLTHLYGASHHFEIVTAPHRGFAVTITIPLRFERAGAASLGARHSSSPAPAGT